MIPKNQFTSQPQFPVEIDQSKPFARGLIRCGLSWSKRDLVTDALLTQSDLIPSIGNASARKGGTASPFTYAAADVVDFVNLTEYTIVSAFVPKTNAVGQNNGIFRTGATSAGLELFLFNINNYPQIRVNGSDILAPTTGPTITTDVLLVAGARLVEGTSGRADVWWSGEQKHSSTFNRSFSADDLYNIGYQTGVATGNTRELQAYWFWDRRLTDAEMAAVTQNPWQIFRPQRTRFPLDAAAATAYSLDTTPGSYALTGSSATTLYDRLVDTTAGSYSLTGSSATTLYDRLVDTTAGSYSLTGSSATTLYDRLVDTTAGSYTLTGVSATLDVVAALTLDTTPGSYTLTGSSATLEYVAALELDTTPGSYTLTGSSATTLYNRLVDTTAGSYSLTGSSATALYGRLIDTTAGSYTLTGSSATTLYDRLVDTTPGIYSLTGSPAELIASAGVSVNVTGVSGTGNVGTVSVAISINALVTGIAGISSIGAVTVSVTSNPDVNVTGVVATGYVGSPLVWGPVDDGQTPNWVIVDDSHSASWTQVLT